MIELWRAAILVIGNEVLIGRVLDTNSQKVAKTLTVLGYDVIEIRKVRDDIDEIAEAIKDLMAKARVIVTTGGLGPTYDDVTAEALAYALGLPLEINEKALEMIREKAESQGLELTKERIKMAIMPKTAKPIPNPVGMAPGIFIKMEGYKIFALPGVPKEMEAMLEGFVVDELEKDSLLKKAESCEVIKNVREAEIAEIINDFVKRFPDTYIKTHPGVDEVPYVKICVLASGETEDEAKRKADLILSKILNEVKRIVGGSAEKVG